MIKSSKKDAVKEGPEHLHQFQTHALNLDWLDSSFIRAQLQSNTGWAASRMTKQQILAIKSLSLVSGALLSVIVPALLIGLDVNSELALGIFAPGLGLISPVHNVLPALIVTVVFDAIVYCAVAYLIGHIVLRFLQNRQES